MEKFRRTLKGLKSFLRRVIPSKLISFYHLFGAILANVYYGFPPRKLKVVGVTGTDGKTTTCNLIYSILKAAGEKVGMVTSINAAIGKESYDTGFHVTSPNPFDLQRFLKKMVDEGCEYAVLEVTSHALDQHRVLGIKFKVAVVTNVTHEHLDYHKSFREYLRAKAKLFRRAQLSILNRDDRSYSYLKKVASGKTVSYGMKPSADIQAVDVFPSPWGTAFSLKLRQERRRMRMKLLGEYNVYNALAAASAALLLGVKVGDIQKAVGTFEGVVGRMEEVKLGQDFHVVIDFAHTPSALKQVLELSSKLKAQSAKLIAVFGCAGERDRKKRPVMGEIAARLADCVILTAEDPRTEDVNKIVEEIAVGCKKGGAKEACNAETLNPPSRKASGGRRNTEFFKIPDRQEAIDFAIQKLAKKDDWVVICGKGHERSMCFGTREHPWSEHAAVRKALKAFSNPKFETRNPKQIQNPKSK